MDNFKRKKHDKKVIQRKQKICDKIEILAASMICIAVIGWFSFSVYQKVEESQNSIVETHEINVNAITNYINIETGTNSDSVSVSNDDSSVSVSVNGANVETGDVEEENSNEK